MNIDSYFRERQSIDAEIKRMNDRLKQLRQQKKEAETNMYKYMEANNMKNYKGIKIEKIKPKVPIKRKPEKDKKKDAVDLFRGAGLPQPENFYEEFKKTQKYPKF